MDIINGNKNELNHKVSVSVQVYEDNGKWFEQAEKRKGTYIYVCVHLYENINRFIKYGEYDRNV